MIHYNRHEQMLASFDIKDQYSSRTNREFTYTYYIDLVQQHRTGVLPDELYYDFEVLMYKYDLNRR